MPDGSGGGDPEATLLLTAEDGLGDTVRPRLEAARADLRLVHAVRAPLTFPEGVPHLGRLVSSTRAKFVIVDPIVAYLGPDVNANDDAEVRRALRPLGRMAEDRGAAVLAIRHHNKSGGTDPMTRGGGSIGFTASARCVLMVVPDDLVPAESVLSVVKANLSRTAPSLRYAIAEGTVLVDGTPCSTSQIDWRGVDGRDARTLLAARRDVVEEEKIERAEDRVLRAVEAQPGLKREELVAAAGGRRGDNGKALAVLVARGEVEKLGRGGRGDPFLYVIPSTGPNRSPTSPGPAGTGDRVQPVPRSRSIGTGGPEGPVRDHGGTGTGSGRLPFHVPEGLP